MMNEATLRDHKASDRNIGLLGDGYDQMEALDGKGWRVLSCWGRDGWDLGSWPYVAIYAGGPRIAEDDAAGPFTLAQVVEGDMTAYSFPTAALRREAVTYLFVWYAVHEDQPWAAGWDPEDEATIPDYARVPYEERPAAPQQKAALTRAIRTRDPETVARTIKAAVAEWNAIGAWPDDWHRWQIALDDVLHVSQHIEIGDL